MGVMSIDAVAHIREETERSVAALTSVDPEQSVPTCPDWTADDLLWHLAEVHEFWAAILESGGTAEEQVMAIEESRDARPAERDALLARRASATEALLSQLAARDSVYEMTLCSIAAMPMPMRISRVPAKPPLIDSR